MSKDTKPLSPTLIRFQEDLERNGLNERSQQSHGRAVRKLSEFLEREPDSASEEDLRNYLLFIKNDLKWSAMEKPKLKCPECGGELSCHGWYRAFSVA